MKIQQDSFGERAESPDLPEPLYEEVGDFGLQVLKSLETSFRSSRVAETQEVPDRQTQLVLSESGHLDHVAAAPGVHSVGGSLETLERSGSSSGADCSSLGPPAEGGAGCSSLGPPAEGGMRPGDCTASQELLLQELSSAFIRSSEEEEKLYDV